MSESIQALEDEILKLRSSLSPPESLRGWDTGGDLVPSPDKSCIRECDASLVLDYVEEAQHLRNLAHQGSAIFNLTPLVHALALVPSSMLTSAVLEAMMIGKSLTLSLVHLLYWSFDYNVIVCV